MPGHPRIALRRVLASGFSTSATSAEEVRSTLGVGRRAWRPDLSGRRANGSSTGWAKKVGRGPYPPATDPCPVAAPRTLYSPNQRPWEEHGHRKNSQRNRKGIEQHQIEPSNLPRDAAQWPHSRSNRRYSKGWEPRNRLRRKLSDSRHPGPQPARSTNRE